jgi:hypothetical protein
MQGDLCFSFLGVAITLGPIVLVVLVVVTVITQDKGTFLIAICLDLIGTLHCSLPSFVQTLIRIRLSVARLAGVGEGESAWPISR